MINLDNILQQTREIVNNAALYIKAEIGKVESVQIEEKELNSLVSYVDKKTENLLVNNLGQLLPGSGFITEEDTEDDTEKDYTWIIDPLDGTTNFLQQIPYFCISVALQYREKIVLGLVHEINLNEQFYAISGKGAYMNGKRIKVSEKDDPKQMIVATGFPYIKGDKTKSLTTTLENFMINARGIRRMGAAAADLCYIAIGRLDAYYELSLNSWDVAAGSLIVKEAGGLVTDFAGGENYIFGGEIIACAPQLYPSVYDNLLPLRKAIQ